MMMATTFALQELDHALCHLAHYPLVPHRALPHFPHLLSPNPTRRSRARHQSSFSSSRRHFHLPDPPVPPNCASETVVPSGDRPPPPLPQQTIASPVSPLAPRLSTRHPRLHRRPAPHWTVYLVSASASPISPFHRTLLLLPPPPLPPLHRSLSPPPLPSLRSPPPRTPRFRPLRPLPETPRDGSRRACLEVSMTGRPQAAGTVIVVAAAVVEWG